MKTLRTLLTSLYLFALPVLVKAQETVTITNPLGEEDPRVIVGRVISGALSVSGSIAILMFVYGGVIWLTSLGKPDWVEKGKRIILWSVLGIVIIAASYVVADAVFNAVLTGSVSGT